MSQESSNLLKTLIESIVDEELKTEAAVSMDEPIGKGFSLFVSSKNRVVLVDTNEERLRNSLREIGKEHSQGRGGDVETTVAQIVQSMGIVGTVAIESNEACNAYEIKMVAAEKGYGPLIFDIALDLAAKNGSGLMIDREEVRPAARKIWSYYYNNRSDIKKEPITDPKCKIMFQASDSEEEKILNTIYYGSGSDTTALENNFKKLENMIVKFIAFLFEGSKFSYAASNATNVKKYLETELTYKSSMFFQGKFHVR